MNKDTYTIGVIGTGFVARGLMDAITRHPRLRLGGVMTRRDLDSLPDMPVAKQFITNNIADIIPVCDLFVECTGDAVHGTAMAEAVFAAGSPLVTMNCELQLVSGSYLRTKGTIVEAEGDQPGSLAALDADVRAMGFQPLVYGNVKKFLNLDPKKDEMEYWSAKTGNRLEQTIAFTDGTKVQMEQALVANGLGATLASRNLSGVRCGTIQDGARELAAVAEHVGTPIADYVLTNDAGGAVFVTAKHDESEKARLEYLKLGPGPYYTLTRPFHLCHLEIPKTILNILERPGYYTFNNGERPVAQVVAVAKRDIVAGERFEKTNGSFDFRGEAVNIAEYSDAVPIALFQNAHMTNAVRAGDIVRFADVELPESRALAIWKDILYNKSFRTA